MQYFTTNISVSSVVAQSTELCYIGNDKSGVISIVTEECISQN